MVKSRKEDMSEKRVIEDLTTSHPYLNTMNRGLEGVVFDACGIYAKVVNVPLFRRSEKGELKQTLRVTVSARNDLERVTFTVLEGEKVLDCAGVELGTKQSIVDLFVPEVHERKAVTLKVENGSAQPFEIEVEMRPQRKWEIFVVHHSHFDFGYTDPQAMVLRNQMQYLDAALELVSTTDDWAGDARFRWNVEATWPLKHWLEARPNSDVQRLVEQIRQGRIEVCALPFSMHTEAYSMDELSRQFRFADEFRERYDLSIDTAMQTDVPGASVGFLNLLVDSGVRYLSVAHNLGGRSAPHLVGGQELTRPFYWKAASGKKILVWYTDSAHGSAYMEGSHVGLADGYDNTLGALPGYLSALADRPYPYDRDTFGWYGVPPGVEVTKRPYPHDILHLRVQGHQADNASPSIIPAEVVRTWNEEWEYPRMRMSTNREFFVRGEEKLEGALETYSGDWTDWWADGIGSAARHLGFNRRAQANIRFAQTLHTLADSLTNDGVETIEKIDDAYEDMALFDEHTWGASDPWDDTLDEMQSGKLQWEKKNSFALDAYDKTNSLLESGLHRLSSILGSNSSSLGSVTVFNPSRWERTDIVRLFVPLSTRDLTEPFALIDSVTGERVSCATEDQTNYHFRPRGKFLSFVARNIPGFGYRRYDFVEGSEDREVSRSVEETVIENEHYRVNFDLKSGAIGKIFDKASGGNLVDSEPAFGFNQYIYDRYGSAPGFNHLSGRVQATDLALLGERSVGRFGAVVARSSNAVWDSLTVRVEGEGADFIETTLTLFHGVRRLDIKNRVYKRAIAEKESVYFAFPFAVEEPSLAYEITGGVDSPEAPRVPGSAHYMRAIRNWVTIEDSKSRIAWATMEAPLVQFENIYLPYLPFPKTLSNGEPATIYSWALNNIWDTNFPPHQSGEMEFNYAIASGTDVDSAELGMRTASALTEPLLGILSPSGTSTKVVDELPDSGSFCEVDHPEVDIVTLTSSRRGQDFTILLQSLASETVEARVSLGLLPVSRVWAGSHLERDLEEIPVEARGVNIEIEAGQLLSLSVLLENGGDESL